MVCYSAMCWIADVFAMTSLWSGLVILGASSTFAPPHTHTYDLGGPKRFPSAQIPCWLQCGVVCACVAHGAGDVHRVTESGPSAEGVRHFVSISVNYTKQRCRCASYAYAIELAVKTIHWDLGS